MANPTDTRLTALEERRQANVGKQVENDRLPAGANMYYYCKGCGTHVSTKPEGWWQDPPPSHCATCKDDMADGIFTRADTFEDWCRTNNVSPYEPRSD